MNRRKLFDVFFSFVCLRTFLNTDFTLRYESFFSDCAIIYTHKKNIYLNEIFVKQVVHHKKNEKNKKGRQNEMTLKIWYSAWAKFMIGLNQGLFKLQLRNLHN